MDRGGCQSRVHRVTKSQTGLMTMSMNFLMPNICDLSESPPCIFSSFKGVTGISICSYN